MNEYNDIRKEAIARLEELLEYSDRISIIEGLIEVGGIRDLLKISDEKFGNVE